MDRRQLGLLTTADSLERDGWYLKSMLDDYNDPDDPITVGEIINWIREAARV